jgi:hypothetical protein
MVFSAALIMFINHACAPPDLSTCSTSDMIDHTRSDSDASNVHVTAAGQVTAVKGRAQQPPALIVGLW